MFARTLLAVCFLIAAIGLVSADTIRGKVQTVDDEKMTIAVDGKTYDIQKSAKVYTLGKAKKGQAAPETLLTLRAIVTGAEVVLTTEKDKVTAIKVEGKKKKNK